MDRCVSYFSEHNYTENRISKYRALWRTGIVRYMVAKGTEEYTSDIGAEFITTCHHNGVVRPQEREKIRSVQVLNDMLELGHIRKRCIVLVHHALDGEIGKEMEKLITHITNLRRSKTTIKDYRLYLSEFLAYLNMSSIHHVYDITENHIVTYISHHPTNKVNILSALRVLFRFWKEQHIVDSRFDVLFANFKVRKTERVPSYFTPTEVMKIEQSIERSSGVGKRNYAMILLASRLGLRASDIAGLRFDNIDWDKNNISDAENSKTVRVAIVSRCW